MTPMFNLPGNGNERQLRRIKAALISRNPNQPRRYFEPEAINQLADSIRQYGVLNPLTVRRTPDGYEPVSYTHLDVYKRQVPNTDSYSSCLLVGTYTPLHSSSSSTSSGVHVNFFKNRCIFRSSLPGPPDARRGRGM